MTEDIQSLLEKINRDGVEKAKAEAAKIVETARAEAAAIVKKAEAAAAKARADAEKAAADYTARAETTLAQASRDVLLKIESSVGALLERVLAKDVDAALADPAAVSALVGEAVRQLASGGSVEIAAGGKLAAALKAQLAAMPALTVVTDETFGTGFSVRTDGGRVEHAFTGEVVAEELARRLRPDLAKLVTGR